jgi:hypothetical protein
MGESDVCGCDPERSTSETKEPTMSDRLFDRLELGARVAQSLVAENDLSPAARRAAIAWRSRPLVAGQAATATRGRAAQAALARPLPALAQAAPAFSCAA